MTWTPTTRRRFIAISGATALAGAAGCTGDSHDDTPAGGDDTDDGSNRDDADDDDTTDGSGSDDDGSADDAQGGDANDADDGDDVDQSDDADDDDASSNDDLPTLETSFRSREQYAQPGELFDDFEDESVWVASSGEMEFDDEVVFAGSQSLKLTATGGDNIVVERMLDGEDLTDLDFSFALYTTTPRNIAVYLEFTDRYGSQVNYQLRRITYREPDVDWFRTCPGVFDIDVVPPEMDELERMRLVVLNTDEAEVWVDDLRVHEKPEKGYVILSWDDGFSDFYTDASELHDEFGVQATQAVIPGYSGDAYMSVPEMHERQDAGDQIVMHGTHDPIHEYDEADMAQRLRNDKQWFVNNELKGADYIIYPHNSFNATSLELKQDYHYCGGCNQSGDVNTTGVHGFDPLVLPRTIGNDLTISKRAVDMAVEGRNCTILNFHRWEADNTISKEEYRELLEHIADKGDLLEVITFEELWQMRMDGH